MVLRRTRRMNDRRVHDRAAGDPYSLFLQVQIHRLQHLPAQPVFFQQMSPRSIVVRAAN